MAIDNNNGLIKSDSKKVRSKGAAITIAAVKTVVKELDIRKPAASAFKFGRRLKGDGQEEMIRNQQIKNEYSKRLKLFYAAIFNPPAWKSIAEMESGWGVTDHNRHIFISRLKRFRAFFVFLGVINIYFMGNLELRSALHYIQLFCQTIICMILVVEVVAASWRLDCLINRKHGNIFDYLMGRS